jgi:hypothetical protein
MADDEKLLTVEEWAELRFSKPPHKQTLWKWVREGFIHPPAVKHGRRWYLHPYAEYCDPKIKKLTNRVNPPSFSRWTG